MTDIEAILKEKIKPKEKQTRLVEALVIKEIPMAEFIAFFTTAADVDKGTLADVMKHVSAKCPDLFFPYIDTLIGYVNYKAPRVKWGVPESIGNMAGKYPNEVAKAIPFLLRNITDEKNNTTVIKWCSAFALTEIAKFHKESRKQLMPVFEKRIAEEVNNGVKNLYVKAKKTIERSK